MKKHLLVFITLCCTLGAMAHDANYGQIMLRPWHLVNRTQPIMGSFYLYKDGSVWIQNEQARIERFPLTDLSRQDRQFVVEKYRQIVQLNTEKMASKKPDQRTQAFFSYQLWLATALLFLFALYIYRMSDRKKVRYLLPILGTGVVLTLFSFAEHAMKKIRSTTSPAFIDSAFTPFKPNINTFWDANYFYVESKGIPTTHKMMVGISNHGWQQQVPIPQCYIGNNAWPIPLNPVMAATPIPVDSIHFTRGAIAIAANGVPIFNVHTNTGVDSYIDGQLDNYGGHCGRADDYHYHIAPLHLYAYTAATSPCAFGLDGYAVYGSVEPDGSSMQTLDANHGHVFNGTYHYHGTTSAPYMIAQMAGQVTEDATHQLVPQAAAHGVRPALTPLNGALITNCLPNSSNNGYTLTYTLGGQTDSIVYSWNASGQYTFNFYTAGTGIPTTNVYSGFTQCVVPTAISEVDATAGSIAMYPNPVSDYVVLDASHDSRIDLFNIEGKKLMTVHPSAATTTRIDVSSFPAGIYLVRTTNTAGHIHTQKLIKQ